MQLRIAHKLSLALLLVASSCLGAGYQTSESEAWVLPTTTALANLRYAVLPVQFEENAIPEELFGPWRTQRRLSLTVHLRRELEDAFKHAGFTLTDREQLGAVLSTVDPIPAAWTRKERKELAIELDAEAVITITMLEAGPERVSALLEATRITDGTVIWRSERTDVYGSETPDQGKFLIDGLINRLRLAGLPLRR